MHGGDAAVAVVGGGNTGRVKRLGGLVEELKLLSNGARSVLIGLLEGLMERAKTAERELAEARKANKRLVERAEKAERERAEARAALENARGRVMDLFAKVHPLCTFKASNTHTWARWQMALGETEG